MLGKEYTTALLASVILTAVTKIEDVVSYSPWCSCKVSAHFTVLLPRPAPCRKHHRKHENRRLYIVLLLLLAGDIELNPGPVNTLTGIFDSDSPIKMAKTADAAGNRCSLCSMAADKLTLRSRTIADALVRCEMKGCGSFAHIRCIKEDTEVDGTEWACTRHMKDKGDYQQEQSCPSHQPTSTVYDDTPAQQSGIDLKLIDQPECTVREDVPVEPSHSDLGLTGHPEHRPSTQQPTRADRGDVPVDSAGARSDLELIVQSEHRSSSHWPPCSDGEDAPVGPPRTDPEPIPGPSFMSASIMDVMEALRVTQLKLDRVSNELAELKQAFRAMVPDDGRRPSLSPAPKNVSRPEEVQAIPGGQMSRSKATNSIAVGKQDLLIIGDSNVRRLDTSPGRSRAIFRSNPGATIEQLGREIKEVSDKSIASKIVLHVGTNDLTRKGSEEIAINLVNLAQHAKTFCEMKQVFICSVTPRRDLGSFIFSRSESVNNRLRSLCIETTGVQFIDLREELDGCPFTGLARDALHYNKVGATRVLDVITSSVGSFLTMK